jgi:hypothetical protein
MLLKVKQLADAGWSPVLLMTASHVDLAWAKLDSSTDRDKADLPPPHGMGSVSRGCHQRRPAGDSDCQTVAAACDISGAGGWRHRGFFCVPESAQLNSLSHQRLHRRPREWWMAAGEPQAFTHDNGGSV